MALKLQDVLAQAFAAEGCEVLFTLMGDANMYWTEAMSRQPGVTVVNARHEHCAVAMADGYARATGKVGVASTTCGPGLHPDHDRAGHRRAGQCAAGGLRRRFADAVLLLHPGRSTWRRWPRRPAPPMSR